MSKVSLYRVCRTLDEPIRVFGLPFDEFTPAAMLFLTFFSLGKVITGITSAVTAVVTVRALKRGKGSGWVLSVLYWHLPAGLMRVLLKGTPKSQYREWIS